MPRRPRIDEPGMAHHVMMRGVEKRRIFLDDRDHWNFIGRLCTILLECGTRCYAWALEPNHGHFVLQTGAVPLATVMARLNTGYAGYFNRRYARVGHLFQNRYKSRPVEDDADLVGLICYVHRNPLADGIVETAAALEDHPWCGHGAMMGRVEPFPFHGVERALSLFGPSPELAQERIRARMAEAPKPRESPSLDLDRLVADTCRALGVVRRDFGAGRGDARVADVRALVAYLARSQGAGLREVAGRLGVSRAAVSKAVPRGAALARGNPTLAAGIVHGLGAPAPG